MARATRAESEATARRVREVARRLFSTHGYAGVGLEQVALECGVTRGAVYHHFAGKQVLLEAVLADVHAEVAGSVVAAADGASRPEAGDDWPGLVAGCRAFVEACLAADVRRLLLVDGPAVLGWARWRALDAAASGAQLDDVLAGLAAQGRVRADLPAAGALLSGAMNEGVLWAADRIEVGALERATAVDAVCAALEPMLGSLRTTPVRGGPDGGPDG